MGAKKETGGGHQMGLHFPSTTSTRVFQMAKPFNVQQANPDARRAEQDPQRRIVFALPRTSGVESFPANLPALI